MADFQLVILTKAVEGRKDELAHWYDAVHIPDHLRVPGYISARRHGVDRLDGPADSLHWDFMTVYELETEDPSAAIAKARRRLGTGERPITGGNRSAKRKGSGSARTRGVAPEVSAQRGTSGAANGGGGRAALPRHAASTWAAGSPDREA